ncbi:MAG TPA: hypothetical protein VG963_18475, partial [Polyangiaceae bacterium]|nr:hypothetical protein [Polyangiaceae bacterium]
MFSTAPRPLVEPLERPARRGLRVARDWLRRPRLAQFGWVALGGAAYHLLWLAVIVLGCWWTLRIAWPFTIDDAGISYAYAKHIALGQGPVAAPGGPRVEGYSNPLWVLLLVPLQWLGLDLPEFAKVLATLAFAGSLVVGRRYLATLDRQRFWAWGATDALFALGLGLCVEFMVWVPAGLENALFGLALLLLADLDARESSAPSRAGWSGLAACALCLTRPEGVLYAAPLLLIKPALAFRDRAFARQVRSFLLCWLVPWFSYQVLHYAVFHVWVANTYFAKPGSQTLGKGLHYLWTSLDESGLRMVVPLAALGVIGQLRQKLVLLWQCVAGVLFALYAGGDWMPYGRFVALFAPSLLLLAACGVRNLVRGAHRVARGRVPQEIWALLMSVPLLAAWRSWQEPSAVKLAKRPWCHFCERVADMSRLRKIGQAAGLPSVSVLTQDFGGPAWVSDEHFYPI